MQLENEVYEYIRQMIDEEASRLEIVESCISEFGDDYPDLEYDDWSKLVKSLITKDEDEEGVSDIYLPPMPSQVSSVKDTYEKALSKLQRMVEWADTSSVPLEKWTVNGVSKWAKQYKECLELCKCLELDYFENSIDDALYNDIASAISKVEEYTSLLPKIKALDERYLDDSNSLNYSRRRKVKIPDYYSRKDKYLTLVSSIPPTTSSERKKLLKRYHDGDKSALDAIIESYLPLIYNMAVQFHSLYPHIDIQDFFGEGVEVFVYNYVLYESRYRNIIGYIMAAVKSRMAKYVGYTFPNFCVPSKSIQLITQIERFIEKYECTYGERPSAEYIASSLGLPFDDVINTCHLITGKNQHITFNEDTVGYMDNFFPDPDSRLLHESLSKEVASTLCTLTPREADILRKFFGIGTKENSLEEIGDKLHLTRERTRQIKETAIRKLNQGQRSHILVTYSGGTFPSQSELDVMSREIEWYKSQEKDEPIVLGDFKPIKRIGINKVQESVEHSEKSAIEILIAEIRDFIKKQNEWLENRQNRIFLTQEEIEEWKRQKVKLNNYYSVLEKNKNEISLKTHLELKGALLDLRKKIHCLPIFVPNPQPPKDITNTSRSGMYWTKEEEEKVEQLYMQDVSCELIAKQLSRSELAIQLRLAKLGFLEFDEDTQKFIRIKASSEVLETYKSCFRNLKRSSRNGQSAPHKVILLLAIIALYINTFQQQTEILVKSPALIKLFDQYWQKNVHSNFWSKDINMPWKQMISEPFWHYDEKTKTTYIDKDLRDLLKDTGNRIALRNVLKAQLKN